MTNLKDLDSHWKVQPGGISITYNTANKSWNGIDRNGKEWFDDNQTPGVFSSSEQNVYSVLQAQWGKVIPQFTGSTTTQVAIYKEAGLYDPYLNAPAAGVTDHHADDGNKTKLYTHEEIVINSAITIGDYSSFNILSHEFGHALGLSHPGGDGFNPAYDQRMTIMSYNPIVDGAGTHIAVTPMAMDIAELQLKYGTPPADNISNIYGFGYFNGDLRMQTVWDNGGYDTFDLSGFGNRYNLTIDLRQALDKHENFHDYKTVIGNEWVYIAKGTVIESAIGGGGNDTIIGNDNGDKLYGGAGNDQINGGAGTDFIDGGTGKDLINGGEGNDVIFEDDAHNKDTMDGGGGFGDTLAFTHCTTAVTIDLNDKSNHITHIQTFDGTNFGDSFTCDVRGDYVYGMGGNDTIIGGPGNDNPSGGDGNDTFVINKGNGADQIDGDAGNDTIQFGPGITPEDVTFTQTQNGELITIRDSGTILLPLNDVENIVYSDGTKISLASIERAMQAVPAPISHHTIHALPALVGHHGPTLHEAWA